MRMGWSLAVVCIVAIPLSAGEKKPTRHVTPKDAEVTLTAPYPPPYKNARTDKISLQFAALMICRQTGRELDIDATRKACGKTARKYVTPDIRSLPFEKAMKALLDPLDLTWTENDKTVTVKPKEVKTPAKPKPETKPEEGEKKVNELTGTVWKRIGQEDGVVEYSWKATVHNRQDVRTRCTVWIDFLDGDGMKVGGSVAETTLEGKGSAPVTETATFPKSKADRIKEAKFRLTVDRDIE